MPCMPGSILKWPDYKLTIRTTRLIRWNNEINFFCVGMHGQIRKLKKYPPPPPLNILVMVLDGTFAPREILYGMKACIHGHILKLVIYMYHVFLTWKQNHILTVNNHILQKIAYIFIEFFVARQHSLQGKNHLFHLQIAQIFSW